MKMHVRRIPISIELPFFISDLQRHLRVDDVSEYDAMINMGRTAAAEIEQFAQIALLTQTIRVTFFEPDTTTALLRLPIGPADEAVTPSVTIDGEAFTDFDFTAGTRPFIYFVGAYHDLTPTRISVEYQAGFGTDFQDVPPDLVQAIMDQAALHYDGRSPMDTKSLTTSPHMARVGAMYRGVRV